MKNCGFPDSVPRPTAIRYIRNLRGGSQAHLIQADDDRFYAAKSPENPQSKRLLVNEYLAGKIFEHLGVASAKMIPLNMPQSFINENSKFQVILHHETIRLHAGLYLGSRYEVDPEKMSVFDFLPAPLLPKVTNIKDFLGALLADQWTCNHDQRQFVFSPDPSASTGSRRYCALAIDHGMCLGGAGWQLFDSPLTGVYFQHEVYGSSVCMSDFEPWLEKLRAIEEEHFDTWISAMPPEWLTGDSIPFRNLVGGLLKRKKRIPDLIAAAIDHNPGRLTKVIR